MTYDVVDVQCATGQIALSNGTLYYAEKLYPGFTLEQVSRALPLYQASPSPNGALTSMGYVYTNAAGASAYYRAGAVLVLCGSKPPGSPPPNDSVRFIMPSY